jgi:predicted nucleic acid-binding protein
MVIVDSSVWIDLLQGKETRQTLLFEQRAALQEIGLPDLVLYEILQGVKDPAKFAKIKTRLLVFPLLDTAGKEIALKAAENSLALRRRGISVKTIDCLLATFCIQHQHAFLTSDSDFIPYTEHLGLTLL